jgi:hypothetical protein
MALNLSPALDVADADAIAARISDAEGRLHAALMAGARTADLHREIADLRAAAARITAAAAAAEAEARAKAAAAHQARVAEAAAAYASTIERRLADRLAALVPPPFSIISPTRT